MERDRTQPPEERTAGFTLVEIVIAVVILSIGVLGLAGTTAHAIRSTTIADLRSERMAARQSVIEQLRALPFDSVSSGTDTVGAYEVQWRSTARGPLGKDLRLITTGPGLNHPAGGSLPTIAAEVPDTFSYVIVR
jgi:prepilin-type N-terminal cleavage/methylation domain-containing protein